MSRRRPHPSDDESERSGYDRKKRKYSADDEVVAVEERLENLLARVGEKSSSSLESNLEGLVSVLDNDLNSYKSTILRLLVECALKSPDKCSVYTTLVGLLNAKNYNFGGEFVEQMFRQFKESMKASEWEYARYALRFLADLVNCHVVSVNSLMQLLDTLIDSALENVPQVRKDWFVYAVLSCLPWIGRELYEKKEPGLEQLLATIEAFLMKRGKGNYNALRVWSTDKPHPQEEFLDCLWLQTQRLKADFWQEKHIQRPYLAFDSVLCEALQHNLPTIQPPSHHEGIVYPMPRVVFRMFDYTDCPEGPVLPGAHSIERFLIEEHLRQILETYHHERKDCAANLLNFPYKQKIPLDYMIVEVIFGEMLKVPDSHYLQVCYGSVFIELCKLQPSTMPQVLAQSTELLFERLDSMNTSCFDRLVSWFAYHLSNFQFRWSWEDWAQCLSLDLELPKPKFIKEVLISCLRLSYHERVSDFMTPEFSAFLPSKPEPHYKYTADGAASLPGTMVAHQLLAACKQKCTSEDALAILNELPNPLKEDPENEPSYNPLKVDVFVQTILHLGVKSFSHSFAAVSKFHGIFKHLSETEESQICVLRSLFDFWSDHQQMICVLIDKMMKTKIVDCSTVANWIFSKEMSGEFTKLYLWEILHLTVRKMSKHVKRLQTELQEAREKLQDAESDSSDSDVDVDDRRRREKADRPTEEMVEKMEERQEGAQADQKNLFLIIFQRFIMILTEHLVRCDTDGKDFNTPWYKWTIGRLQQVFMLHHEQVHKYSSTLETLLFTQDLDRHILESFQQFLALRA